MQRQDEQIVETTTEARQGVTEHNVRYVLVWGHRWRYSGFRYRLFPVFPVNLAANPSS
jgi:hypothetical protein